MMEEATRSDRDTILEMKNLRTYFFLDNGTVRAVDGVDLKLDRNTTLGLVGESGCGKSVTARSAMRLIQSPPGKIVNGEIWLHRNGGGGAVDIAGLDPRGRAMRDIRGDEISMIFQEPMTSLNPLYTVGGQIAEAVELHQKVDHREAMDRALEMLIRVQMSEPKQRLHEYPHQLSGGMRQRVMIALALSCNPSILIADEPTTALDVTVQAQILDLMRELQEDFGSAIIMITHNLGVISQTADYVAVMYLGKIVEYANVHSVFHDPLHPYTVGLLDSIPVFGQKGEKVLVPIKGMVPTPTEEIRGCAFAPRCPRVRQQCTEETPDLQEAQPGHQVACWLHE
ncbi:MAG: Oligopeptide transport ATP-binding protein OppD [Anaerolineales bacterium]|nr:Oligopeptide transport ATP-binding protein OppD [Anaerolineales bacterium]